MKRLDYNKIDEKIISISAKYYLSMFSCLIFITYATSGYTGDKSNLISLGLCLIWFGISFCVNPKVFLSTFREKKVVFFLMFLLFFITTSLATAGIYNTFKYVGSFLILFSPMFIYSYYERLHKTKLLRKLLYSVYVIWFFFVFKSLYFYFSNPGAARKLTANRDAFGDIAIGGGYPLAIGSTILAVFIIDLLRNRFVKNILYKFILYLAVTILFLVVIETRSTITLLGLIFGVVISLFINSCANKTRQIKVSYKLIFMLFLYLILILIIFININNIGYKLMDLTAGHDNPLLMRLYEVGVEMAEDGYGNSKYLAGRLGLLLDSFKLFTLSPFIGNGYKYGYDFYSSKLFGIGNHSEWLDILSIYGLFGGIGLLLTYYYGFRATRKYNRYITMTSYIFATVFLGIFNPFKSFQAHLIVFFVIPSSYALINKKFMCNMEG